MQLEALEIPVKAIDSAFKATIAGAIGIVAGFTAGAVAAFKATETWALELDGIQDVIGGTAKQAAAFNFVLRKSGVATDTFTKGLVILGKGLVKADGSLDTVGKDLEDFGISVLDANGQVRDQSELIGDITEKYSSFATQQERVNFLTSVFGRSGADLIDFFDTLAAEGGMDAVTEKVERFGLAIDPGRYEQFNRNLAEMRLIGLGLAVTFTEKIMPSIERFLGLITDPKLSTPEKLAKIFEAADTFIGTFVKGLGDSINDWVAGGGAEELSDNLVSWIEGIGDSDAVKSKTQIAMEHLARAIGNALREIDWSEVQAALGDKIEEMFDANRPRGQNTIADFFDSLEVAGTDATRNFLDSLEMQITDWLRNNMANIFLLGGMNAANQLTLGFAPALASFPARLFELQTHVTNRLTDIAKVFYARAAGWGNQAVAGFLSTKEAVLKVVRQLRDEINAIFRRIITSFTLTLRLNNTTGGSSGSSNLGSTTNLVNQGVPPSVANQLAGSTGTGGSVDNRASGGPVIAGQSYNVAEFFKPEVFTPGVNGRVDPMTAPQPATVQLDEARLVRLLVQGLIQAEGGR